MRLVKSFKNFQNFLDNAAPGDRFEYYSGRLGDDRQENPATEKLAKQAMDMYLAGKVTLAQQPISMKPGKESYAYLAIRTASKAREFRGCYEPGFLAGQ